MLYQLSYLATPEDVCGTGGTQGRERDDDHSMHLRVLITLDSGLVGGVIRLESKAGRAERARSDRRGDWVIG